MRRLRLPILLALAVSASLVVPAVAGADAAGPTFDNTSLSNAGVPCSSTSPVLVNGVVAQSIRAQATDAQPTAEIAYTFAIWPTSDQSAEVDRQTTVPPTDVATMPEAPLSDATDYSWRVQAADDNGTSDWSATCQFHLDATPPSAPAVTSSNYPSDAYGPYGAAAQFTFDSQGDTDAIGFRYRFNDSVGGVVCSLELSKCPDFVPVSAPGGSASLTWMPSQIMSQYVTVEAVDAARNASEMRTYYIRVPITPAPTIGGTPAVGQTLTATVLAWSPAADTSSYQWLANGTPISGATGLTYLVQPSDAGKSISFELTGVKDLGSVTKTSSALAIPPLSTFTSTPKPTMTGTSVVGQVLTANPGAWSPTPMSYKYLWFRSGHALSTATGQAYRLQANDGGALMSVQVTAVRAGYTSVAEHSGNTSAVRKLFVAPTPGVSGVRRFGQVLTAVVGTWTPVPTSVSYRWYVGTAPIAGATGARYAPPAAYVGKPLSVVVTGARAGYATTAKRSGVFTIAPASFTVVPSPRVLGVARVGSVLTASMPATTPASAGYRYQWLANGVVIAGQTGSRYAVRPTDVDRRISVLVTAVRSGYGSVQRGSAGTAAVPGRSFANCTALKQVYPYGVARVGVQYNHTPSGNEPLIGPPFFSNSLYSLNAFSDRDKDGIACETS